MITDYLGTEFPVVRHSEAESRRFSRKVTRLTVPEHCKWSDREIIALANSAECDLLILRSPTSRNRLGGMLGSTPSIQTIHADTLLYYSCPLLTLPSAEDLPEGFAFSSDPVPTYDLEELVVATFADYQNHYSANPDLPAGAVQDGYAEWVMNTLTSSHGHLVSLVSAKKIVAFIVYSVFQQVNGELQAEVLLNGTHPAHRNKGLYASALSRSLSDAMSLGAQRMWISTQASHRAMIRTWEKTGLRFELGLNTYHCSRRRRS